MGGMMNFLFGAWLGGSIGLVLGILALAPREPALVRADRSENEAVVLYLSRHRSRA